MTFLLSVNSLTTESTLFFYTCCWKSTPSDITKGNNSSAKFVTALFRQLLAATNRKRGDGKVPVSFQTGGEVQQGSSVQQQAVNMRLTQLLPGFCIIKSCKVAPLKLTRLEGGILYLSS